MIFRIFCCTRRVAFCAAFFCLLLAGTVPLSHAADTSGKRPAQPAEEDTAFTEAGLRLLLFIDEDILLSPHLSEMGQALAREMQAAFGGEYSMETDYCRLAFYLENKEQAAFFRALLRDKYPDVFVEQYGKMRQPENGYVFVVMFHEHVSDQIVRQGREQTVVVLRSRLSAMGVDNPVIEDSATGVLDIFVPGDFEAPFGASLLGATSAMDFRLVRGELEAGGEIPAGCEVLEWALPTGERAALLVEREPLLRRTDISNAFAIDFEGRPMLSLETTLAGLSKLKNVRPHIGQRIAIVLDGTLLSAPIIMDPVLDIRLVLDGSFTNEDEAEQLAQDILAEGFSVPVELIYEGLVAP